MFHVFPADATFPDGWKAQPCDIGFVAAFAACVIPSVTASPVSREFGRRFKYSPNGGVVRERRVVRRRMPRLHPKVLAKASKETTVRVPSVTWIVENSTVSSRKHVTNRALGSGSDVLTHQHCSRRKSPRGAPSAQPVASATAAHTRQPFASHAKHMRAPPSVA